MLFLLNLVPTAVLKLVLTSVLNLLFIVNLLLILNLFLVLVLTFRVAHPSRFCFTGRVGVWTPQHQPRIPRVAPEFAFEFVLRL